MLLGAVLAANSGGLFCSGWDLPRYWVTLFGRMSVRGSAAHPADRSSGVGKKQGAVSQVFTIRVRRVQWEALRVTSYPLRNSPISFTATCPKPPCGGTLASTQG